MLEPFNKDIADVDWLTWAQVDYLYLTPQREMNQAMHGGGESGGGSRIDGNTTTHGPAERPKTLKTFIAACRGYGMMETDEQLRVIYEGGGSS